MTEEEAQERVVAICNEINNVLSGFPMDQAKTALTLVVVGAIVATSEDRRIRELQAHEFGRQVMEYVKREDIVRWMRDGMQPDIPTTSTRQ